MVKLKQYRSLIKERCPKCHGNMVLEFDYEAGYYKSCLNCGHVGYLRSYTCNGIRVVSNGYHDETSTNQIKMVVSQSKN